MNSTNKKADKKTEWQKPRIEQLDVKKTAGGVGTANENAHTPGS